MEPSFFKRVCTVYVLTWITTAVIAQGQGSLAYQHLQEVSGALHLSERDLEDVILKDEFTSRGITYVHLGQKDNGIEVWNSDMNFAIKNGQVVSMSGSFISGIQEKVSTKAASINAEQAIAIAAQHVGLVVEQGLEFKSENDKGELVYNEAGISYSPITAKRFYQLLPEEELRQVWNINIQELSGLHWWNIRVDAENGKVLEKNDWVVNCKFDEPAEEHCEHDHTPEPEIMKPPVDPNDYNVFLIPVESPIHGSRSIINAPWNAALNASPYGWHDTNGAPGAEFTITRGNNVRAQEDRNANNGTGYSPDGGPDLEFDFPLNLSLDPIDYEDAAITNLFYWNNVMHDVLYQYGFDEPSGNFQENNYGNGGAGSDYVNADAQDGAGFNNANFATPADGGNPRMQMYIWTSGSPDRDGDLDNGIITHEYGHGVSNRLVGGPSNVNCLFNAERMGEGWSDIWSLLFTQEVGDQGGDARGIGTYAIGQSVNGGGIRPAPYSTNIGVNAYTYGNVGSLAMPHGVGFLWCTMLWELNWELIDNYGFDPDLYNGTGGNNICMQLIIDGMKLTPCSPGFVDARDAILLADQINNGGANSEYIWAAFAKRGLGFSADQGSPNSTTDGTEAFDLPPNPKDNDMAILASISPVEGDYLDCFSNDLAVEVELSNQGLLDQTNIPLQYQLDGGVVVSETYVGTIAAAASVNYQFTPQIDLSGLGVHALSIWSALSNDERTSNDTLTVILNVIDGSGAVTDDFESYGLCSTNYDCGTTNCALGSGWTQIQNGMGDDIDWRVNEGATPSSNTGPTQDYLPGNTSGNYIYLEASNGCNGETAILESPCVDLTMLGSPVLNFAYHMWGSDMGELHVDLFDGTAWVNDIISPITGDQGNSWLTTDVDLSIWSGQVVRIRFRGITGSGYQSDISLDAISILDLDIKVNINVYLQGPYDPITDLMKDDLREAGYIPTTEPYTALGFTHVNGGGGEMIDPNILTVTGTDAVVDWVLVELREANNSSNILATRSALVQRDGDVVDVDGTSSLAFTMEAGTYFVAVRHRNHLGVMTQSTEALSNTTIFVDLSSGSTALYGLEPMNTSYSRHLMWTGNSIPNTTITYTGVDNDRDPILISIGGATPTLTLSGYNNEDLTLDGIVKYTGSNNDRDRVLVNIGGTVPTNTREEQLP